MDHCCICERSKRRNKFVFASIAALAVLMVAITALSLVRRNWLALAGWGLWTLLMVVSLTFTDGWRTWCIEHELEGHLR